MVETGREPEGNEEPDVQQHGIHEPAHAERGRQSSHQRDREGREDPPAPGITADAESQRGDPGADQGEHRDVRGTVR